MKYEIMFSSLMPSPFVVIMKYAGEDVYYVHSAYEELEFAKFIKEALEARERTENG